MIDSQPVPTATRGAWKWCAVLLMLCCCSAHAATIRIVVNTTADDFGTDNTHCSLREALYAMSTQTAFGGCALGSGSILNSIALSSGTYAITRTPVQGNAYAGGAFLLNSSILLQGAGAAETIIDAQSVDSVFVVKPGAGVTTLMTDLTIRGGRSAANVGAGIYHQNGKLFLQRVVVTGNRGGYGIYSFDTDGLSLNQVTVSGNQNTGVYISNYQFASSSNSIINTTVSANVSPTQPGGVYLYAGSGKTGVTTISNSTIAFNTGRGDGQNVRAPGGLAIYGDGATLYLRNSIVARNLRGDRQPEDCDADSATIISQGYNIIERDPFCPFQGDTAHDITGIAPQLAPLWDYGGGIPTHAVFPGTLARNAGNPTAPGSGGAACEATDARGIVRSTNTPCDIGAYEYHADFVVNSTADVSDYDTADHACATTPNGNVCTLRAAIDQANANSTFTTIEVPPGQYTITKPQMSNYIDNIDGDFVIFAPFPVTLVGAGADKTIVSGGNLDGVLTLGSYNFDSAALHGLTLTGGNGFSGGGTRVFYGHALFDQVRVTGNTASQGNGLWVSSQGDVHVVGSTIDNNKWNGTQEDGGGGGIYVDTSGYLNLLNSTLANNVSAEGGGGIYNFGGTVDIAFSTIAYNNQQGASPDGGIGGSGGTYRVVNSIIAGNIESPGAQHSEADCDAVVQLPGYIFIENTSNCTFNQPSYVITGYDPLLSPLMKQSGTMPTVAPLAQSQLFYATSQKSECVDLDGNQMIADQRNVDRPNAYNWGNPQYCVIGAYQGVSDVIFANGFQ